MSNWYRIIKQANSLAKSLGIPSDSFLFREIQKFEKQLKDNGDWSKIISMKKAKGKDEAIKKLRNTINDYQLDLDNNPPDVQSYQISHLKRTSTGGDWYSFHHDFEEEDTQFNSWLTANEEILEENYIENVKYNIMDELESYYQDLHEKLDERFQDYLEAFEKREESSGQESMPFYENSQIIRLQKRYNRLRSNLEQKSEEAEKLLNRLYSKDNLEYFFKEYLGSDEDQARDRVEDYFYNFDQYAVDVWQGEEEFREEQKEKERSEELKDYFKLTCGASWCISQPGDYLEQYLQEGYEFLVLRRNKEARVAIRHMGSEIEEIQGIGNSFDNINALDAIDLMECPVFNMESILEGLRDEAEYVDDDERHNHLVQEFLEMDDDIVELKSIQESINKNIDKFYDLLMPEDYGSKTSNIESILSQLSEYELEDNNFIKQKLIHILRKNFEKLSEKEFESLGPVKGFELVSKIIEMMQEGDIELELITDFFKPYASLILPNFFEYISLSSNEGLKDWAKKEALEYLNAIFGQEAINYANKYGIEKSDNFNLSKQDTIKYINNSYFLIYGADYFRNNPEAVEYVVNTIMPFDYVHIFNKLYNFLDIVSPEMKLKYGQKIASRIVSLVIENAEKVYPKDHTNQRHDILKQLLIDSTNQMSSRRLHPELINLIHNDNRVKHLKGMRKILDFTDSPDPNLNQIYPQVNNENEELLINDQNNNVQASGGWYRQ